MGFPLLQDIVVILALAIVVTFTCKRLGIPAIVALFFIDIFAGPHVMGLVGAHGWVDIFAEVGVILLLFAIGLEFSLRTLLRLRTIALPSGAMQVGLTIGATGLLSTWRGIPLAEAVFLSFLLALSSTAVVLKLLQERGDIAPPTARSPWAS